MTGTWMCHALSFALAKDMDQSVCRSYLSGGETKTREPPYKGQGCETGSEALLQFLLVSELT